MAGASGAAGPQVSAFYDVIVLRSSEHGSSVVWCACFSVEVTSSGAGSNVCLNFPLIHAVALWVKRSVMRTSDKKIYIRGAWTTLLLFIFVWRMQEKLVSPEYDLIRGGLP